MLNFVNFDWAKDNIYKNKVSNIIANGLKQVVKDYTRVTKNSKTIIDYVITNSNKVDVKIKSNNKIAYHEAINI